MGPAYPLWPEALGDPYSPSRTISQTPPRPRRVQEEIPLTHPQSPKTSVSRWPPTPHPPSPAMPLTLAGVAATRDPSHQRNPPSNASPPRTALTRRPRPASPSSAPRPCATCGTRARADRGPCRAATGPPHASWRSASRCRARSRRPARRRRPRPATTVSATLGRTTDTSSTSARNCMSRSLAVMPPSTRRVLRRTPESVIIASTTSRVCHAVASSTARARWPLVM